MNNAIAILLALFKYAFEHQDEVKEFFFEVYNRLRGDTEVEQAVTEFTQDPNEERVASLKSLIQSKGEDPEKLNAVLVNKATIEV